jgi:cytochrome c-type protein NapC
MYEFVYQDYTGTSHFANRAGVRASCPDCHVPREWVHKVVRKISATNELFHWLRGSIETPEKFEARREVLAERVWSSMVATDSRECRNCHDIAAMSRERQGMTAGATHDLGERWQMTCIDCHKGVVHSLPASFDKKAEMDSLHDQIETAEVPCGLCHEGMAGAGDEDDWD